MEPHKTTGFRLIFPNTGGVVGKIVRCDLERRKLSGEFLERLHRVVTPADIDISEAPAVDAETLRREQLEALGYF